MNAKWSGNKLLQCKDDGTEQWRRNMPTGLHKYVYVMNVLILIFFSALFHVNEFVCGEVCVWMRMYAIRLWFCYFVLIEKIMSNWTFNNSWTLFLLHNLACSLYFYFEEHLYLILFFVFRWMASLSILIGRHCAFGRDI